MARIPVFTARRSLDPGSPVRYPGDLGTGQALSGFGETLARSASYLGNQAAQEQNEEKSRFEALYQEANRQREGIENFEAEQGFLQTKLAVSSRLPEIAQETPASGAGYHDRALQTFDENAEKFLSTVPDRLRDKMQTLVQTERMAFSSREAATELEQRNGWYRNGLTQALERGQEQAYNNPAAVEAARQETLRAVEASGLPEAEKEEWRQKVEQGVSTAFALSIDQAQPGWIAANAGITVTASQARLAEAVIGVESSGDPNAVSPVGASGLMQVMPETGEEIAAELGDRSFPMNGNVEAQQAYLKRPDVSRRYGTHYLNKMLDRYGGDIDAALIAYNGGATRADAWLEAGRDDSVIPQESADYYKKVRARLGDAVSGSLVLQGHVDVAKAFIGASEGRDFKALSSFIKRAAGVSIDPRQTAWCAAFVNAVLGSQGVQGTGRLNARSFLQFGAETDRPQQGDIVVLSRGDPNGWQGHVGFFAGYDQNGNVLVLGGNQGNRVSVAPYSKDKVLGFRRPPDAGNAAKANAMLANLPGGGPTGGMVVTNLDPRLSSIPFAERIKLVQQSQRAAESRLEAARSQEKAAYTAHNDALELAALRGELTEEQIYNDPILSDGDKASRIRTVRAQQTEKSATDLAVQEYISGADMGWNPLDSSDTSTANKVFDAIEAQTEALDDQTRVAVRDDFIRRTGLIPSSIAADLRRGAFSEQPDELAAAMDEAARIESYAPDSFRSMSGGEDLRKDLASYRHLVNGRGFSSRQAAERLIERRKPEYRVNEDILGTAADKAARDLTAEDAADAFDEGVLSRGPGPGADVTTQNALLAEYREAFREEYIRVGGDEDEAKERAAKELSRTWGISTLSGDKQMMKYPPERFYPTAGGSHEYLSADAVATAAEFAGEDPTRVMLRPDPATAADIRAGRPPRYRLLYEREVDGQTVIDQVPGYWAMPADDVRATNAEARQERMQRAREEREFQSGYSSGLDRDRAADEYLGMFGLPAPRDNAPRTAPSPADIDLGNVPPAAGLQRGDTASSIRERLDVKRQQMLQQGGR